MEFAKHSKILETSEIVQYVWKNHDLTKENWPEEAEANSQKIEAVKARKRPPKPPSKTGDSFMETAV